MFIINWQYLDWPLKSNERKLLEKSHCIDRDDFSDAVAALDTHKKRILRKIAIFDIVYQ